MATEKGYPLPDGDAFTEDLECAIVYYPAKAEYRQALLGSLAFLATWRAWERDTGKRGKDAALAWSNAFELTMGCWNMACLEELLTNQEWMMEWMATHSLDCCEGTTYGDTTIITTIIVPWIGDAPDFYGETAVTDWDDWAEHVCYNGNAWVDLLIENALVLEEGLLAGGVGMGMLAYVLAGIAFIATGGLLAIPVIMLGAASLAALEGSGIFSDAADDLETGRDDIVCALINGLDVGQAVEDALGSGTAWDLVFSLLNYDTPTAIIYEGGGQDSYLPSDTSSACDCVVDPYNGWRIQQEIPVDFAYVHPWPTCGFRTSKAWSDMYPPVGAGTVSGTLRVTGNIHLAGVFFAHDNCIGGLERVIVQIMSCYDSSLSFDHSCEEGLENLHDVTMDYPNPINLTVPFDYERVLVNAQAVSIGTKTRVFTGQFDCVLDIEVDTIEFT